MSIIAQKTGHTSDASTFNKTTSALYIRWRDMSVIPSSSASIAYTPHFYNSTATNPDYDNKEWAILPSLYADRALNLSVVDQQVYDIQTSVSTIGLLDFPSLIPKGCLHIVMHLLTLPPKVEQI